MIGQFKIACLDERCEIYSVSGFGRPFGLNQDKSGSFYITDMDLHAVFRISSDLNSISSLSEGKWLSETVITEGFAEKQKPMSPRFFNGPHAIDFGLKEEMFVTTYYSPLIRVLAGDGQPLYDIGSPNSLRPLKGPASSFFDSLGRLIVAEYAQDAILAYSASGDYLGELGLQEWDRPHMIKESRDRLLYGVDTWNHRLQIFSLEGEWVSSVDCDGLSHPVAISFAESNEFAITSWGDSAIGIFTESGKRKYIMKEFHLAKPYDAQFLNPWFVIADSHHGRVIFIKTDQFFKMCQYEK